MGFYWVLRGFTGFHGVLLGLTGFNWGFTGILLGFTGFHGGLLGFTGALLGFTGPGDRFVPLVDDFIPPTPSPRRSSPKMVCPSRHHPKMEVICDQLNQRRSKSQRGNPRPEMCLQHKRELARLFEPIKTLRVFSTFRRTRIFHHRRP